MRKTFAALVVLVVCVAPAAMAADDGNTQPKVNSASSNSSSTATDIIATTNGSGNVKGVACGLNPDGFATQFPQALVKFYVNGGAAQSVTITGEQHPIHGDAGYEVGYTGWVPFNVRFTSSIRVTIQKASSAGSSIDCAVSWGLD